MKNSLIALATTFSVLLNSNFASADSVDDAKYIVRQTTTMEIFQGVFTALGPVLNSAITHDLQKEGIEISDVDEFTKILVRSFSGEFIEIVRLEVTKPLPTGVGRILDMLLQVLKYDVLSDGTVGG